MKDPILITGCVRSGLTMTARAFFGCGAYCDDTQGANSSFTNQRLSTRIVAPYLRLAGGDTRGQWPLVELESLPRWPLLREHVQRSIGFEAGGLDGGEWFYKDHRIASTWPHWNASFPDARWIIVRRETEAIVNACLSTRYMDGYSTREGWDAWVGWYVRRLQEIKRTAGAWREVWPSKFFAGDTTELREAIEWAGLTWTPRSLDFLRKE